MLQRFAAPHKGVDRLRHWRRRYSPLPSGERVGRGAVPRTDELLLARAKKMRAEPTWAEAEMWRVLRAKQFESIKFSRQVVIAPYIADFVARSLKLIVEIDGETHAWSDDRDARRTCRLEAQGYRVIRFANADVRSNLEGVASAIGEAIAVLPRTPTTTRTPRAGGCS